MNKISNVTSSKQMPLVDIRDSVDTIIGPIKTVDGQAFYGENNRRTSIESIQKTGTGWLSRFSWGASLIASLIKIVSWAKGQL